MLSYKLDFNACAIWDGFCKFSHILCLQVSKDNQKYLDILDFET